MKNSEQSIICSFSCCHLLMEIKLCDLNMQFEKFTFLSFSCCPLLDVGIQWLNGLTRTSIQSKKDVRNIHHQFHIIYERLARIVCIRKIRGLAKDQTKLGKCALKFLFALVSNKLYKLINHFKKQNGRKQHNLRCPEM